jgi:uncharacterized protein YodC (DUF2158 family)
MKEELKLGDVVRLASGGPKMTVSPKTKSDPRVSCLWFEGFELKGGMFHPEVLKKVE